MQYSILTNQILLSKTDKDVIESNVGLYLSRFNSIVTQCKISFLIDQTSSGQDMISCHLLVSTTKTPDFEVSNSADTISDALLIALGRVQRGIERHLKRTGPQRMRLMQGRRTG